MNALATPPQIANLLGLRSFPLTNCMSGVYFLLEGDEVVYVGQSVNIAARIAQHCANKTFDRAYGFPVAREEMNIVEGAFIQIFKPRYNRVVKSNGVTFLRGPTTFRGVRDRNNTAPQPGDQRAAVLERLGWTFQGEPA